MKTSFLLLIWQNLLNTIRPEIVKHSALPIDPSIFQRYTHTYSRALIDTANNGPDSSQLTPATNSIKNAEQAKELIFTLKDVEKLDCYVKNIQAQITEKVLGDIENLLLVKNLEQSYQMYDRILTIFRNYNQYHKIINSKAQYVKAIADFAYDFVQEIDPIDLEVVLPEEGNIDADVRNKVVLMQLLERLRTEVNAFEDAVVVGFNDKFVQIKAVHTNKNFTDDKKIQMLIDSCEDLIIFKRQVIDTKGENILAVRDLIIQNPKYHALAYEIKHEDKYSHLFKGFKLAIFTLVCLLLAK